MADLKPISKESVSRAIAKAERYRLLNEPREAESICRDVLAVDPGNHDASVCLILALTDLFHVFEVKPDEVRALLIRLPSEYERAYYAGVIDERWAKALLLGGYQPEVAYGFFRSAMDHYDAAEAIAPEGNDDAVLRWNACVRIIDRYGLSGPEASTHGELDAFDDDVPVKMMQQRPPASRPKVSWREALRVWAMVGLQSFGGPAGQIAVMHRILVEEKRWIGERRFLHALNYCMLLPGPEAMQLATYVGWLMHRTAGGLLAGTLFVLPGFLSILALSLAYAAFHDSWTIETLFFGVKAGVLAIVVQAVLRIGRRVLKNWVMVAIAAAAFVGIHLLRLPFPVIVIGAGVIGLLGGRFAPGSFRVVGGHGAGKNTEPGLLDTALGDGRLDHAQPNLARAIRTAIVWGAIWLTPVGALAALLGRSSVYTQEAVFFSKAAVVTFGGAYSVLAYVAQQAVERFGWLAPGEMLDGLGMAETTPGPLIQVVQFVGFMGAFRDSGGLHPLVAGTLASALVTWVTFAPCFLWIFVGAPYVEALRGRETLTAGLSAITAAIVGVILNLAVWFGLHTLFRETFTVALGPGSVLLPRPGTVDWASLAVVGVAFVLVFGAKWGTLRVLACSVALGFGLRALF